MRIKHLLVAAIAFSCLTAKAQPGALDQSFGSFGIVVTTESMSRFENILPLSNGQFLLTDHELAVRYYPNGATESYTFSKFWRYNANGTLDLTYGRNGKREFWSSDEYHQYFTSFAVMTDGSIVATESVQVLGSSVFPLNRIWKFNADGTGGGIIAELSVFGYFSVNLKDITVDKNNRIVVTGYVRGTTGADRNRTYIARLFGDGSFDETFFNGGFRVLVENSSYNYSGRRVTTDAANNIIIWEDGFYNEEDGSFISKFKENGSMETSFPYVKTNAVVRSLLTDGNSKIVYLNNSVIKRLNTDGSEDISITADFSPTKLLIQPDNKILAIGGNTVFKVGRFKTDGTFDQSFGTNGYVTTDLNLDGYPSGALYRNRRLYVSGYIVNSFAYGTILAYDGSDVRMNCPSPQNPYNVDAGKCYATVNGINAMMSSSTLYANVQHKLEYNGAVVQGEGGVAGKQFQLGTTKVTYSYTDITTQTCSFNITVSDKDPPVAKCKDVTVELDASGNGTLTAAQVDNGSTDGCGIQSRILSKTNFNCSDPALNTVTLTVTDIHGNSSTCTTTVTVVDNVPPVAKCKNITVYLDATGNVSITSSQVDDGSTDACGIKSLVLSKTSFDCTNKGGNTVTLTVTDNNDNTSTCTATVTVVDNINPEILNASTSTAFLSPPDLKMKNVTVNYTLSDNCPGTTASLTVTSDEPESGLSAADKSPDWIVIDEHTVQLRAERNPRGDGRVYTITITATDAAGNISTVAKQVMVVHHITGPRSGATFKAGSTVSFSGVFWDVPGNTHTARWLVDGKTSVKATLTEPGAMKNGTVSGSYKFTAPGVYKLQMNVTDQSGVTSYANSDGELDAIVVVYDPNGGYTYGGGSYHSPAGSFPSDPSVSGEVSYGFTVNYYKTATYPKGETQFNFTLGEFEFNAVNFDYLVINKTMAQFKGTGKITGGQSGVGFTMTVTDGDLDGTGVDKIRMKIYNKTNNAVIYDNQPGASDAALPTQAVGANSVVVIQSNSNIQQGRVNADILPGQQTTIADFDAKVFPNPSNNRFNILITGSNRNEQMMLRVYDATGKLIEAKNNLNAGTLIEIGDAYKPGIYLVRITQGNNHKELKLVKLSY